MNDLTHRSEDDLLRDALRAEAAGIEAGEGLRVALHAQVARHRRPGRVPWLLAAAAVLVVVSVGAAVALGRQDEPDEVTVTDGSSPTSGATDIDPVDAFLDVMPDEVACGAGESLDLALYTEPSAPDPPPTLVDHLRADARVASVRTMSSAQVAARVREGDGVVIDPAVTPPVVLVDLVDPGEDEADLRGEMNDDAFYGSVVIQADVGCLPDR